MQALRSVYQGMSKDSKINIPKPKHIAIIMDGNGRWAKEKGKDRIYGHQHGVASVRAVVEGCSEEGIEFLTLYAFSTENWNRPAIEVQALMELLVLTIHQEVDELIKNKVRLRVIGDLSSLPPKSQIALNEAIELTSKGDGLTLILALSYSSKWEINQAIKTIMKLTKKNQIHEEEMTDEFFHSFLATAEYPDPELMIRTGGEKRMSNFLLYQLAYAELYFTEVHWPDFRKSHLREAILNYQNRERRFGKTSEQLHPTFS